MLDIGVVYWKSEDFFHCLGSGAIPQIFGRTYLLGADVRRI